MNMQHNNSLLKRLENAMNKKRFQESLRTPFQKALRTIWGKPLKAILGVSAFALLIGGGILANAADQPAFNATRGDYSTFMVAKSNQPWGASADVSTGEVINLQVWDHNSVVDTVAHNVMVKINLETTAKKNMSPEGQLWADNAKMVSNTVAVNATTESYLTYVPGSAKLLKNINGKMTEVNWPTNINPDNVVTTGINLGDQKGCWDYAQAVRIQVRVDAPIIQITTNKRVELTGGAKPFDVSADAQPSDTVSFKIYVQNTGNATGKTPTVVDTLDSKLTYVPNSSYRLIKRDNNDYRQDLADANINIAGQTITWTFEDMAPTPDTAFYLIFKAKVADKGVFPVGKTVINNKATASFVGATAETNNVTVNVTKQVDPVVTFSLRKEVMNITNGDSKWYDQQLASAAPGDTVAYRMIIINTGNVPAKNVTLKDTLPAGVSFAGNVKLYNQQNQNGIVINGTDLINGGYIFPTIINGTANQQTIIFNGKLTTNCTGQQTLTNKAQVLYNGSVKAQDDATVIFSCTRGMIITKDIQDPKTNLYKDEIGIVKEGQVLSYRINVQNNGNVTLNNPVLRDVLPDQVEYVANSLSIDGEFMSADIQYAFLHQGITLTNLTPGLGKDVRFQVRVKDCPPFGNQVLTNTAYAKADGVAEISDTAKATLVVSVPTL